MDSKYRSFFVAQKTVLASLDADIADTEKSLAECRDKVEIIDKSKEIVNAVTMATLQEIKVFIEEAVSLCLVIVYGDEYSFELDYEVKRGRSEARMWLVKGGNRLDPKSEIGGGVIDVISFALRIIMWILSQPRTEPVFICDEPFRFVSRDNTYRLVTMIKEVCETFDAQFVIVSHNDELIDGAGKYVKIKSEKGVSEVDV